MSATSWKTTVSGYVASAAGLTLALSQAGVVLPKWATITAAFVMAGGIAGVGATAKDASVHSTAGEVQASTIDSSVKAAAKTAGA